MGTVDANSTNIYYRVPGGVLVNIGNRTSKVFIANVIENVVGFLALAFFARELGPAEFGIFVLFQTVLNILSVPADIGIQGAITKRVSEGSDPDIIFSVSSSIKLILILIASVFILLFSSQIDNYIGGGYHLWLLVALVAKGMYFIAQKILQGKVQIGRFAGMRISRILLYALAGLIFTILGFGANGLIIALIISFGIMGLIGLITLNLNFVAPEIETAKSLLSYGKYNMISHIGGLAYSWTDTIIMGFYLSSFYVGIYEIAWRISHVSLIFSLALGTTIFPVISKYVSDGKISEVEEVVRKGSFLSISIVVPAFFGALAIPEAILSVVFGEEYAIGATVLILLMFEKVFQGLHIVLNRALHGFDLPDISAKITLITILINILLNLILINYYGFVGAAAATVVSFILNTVFTAYHLSKIISISIPIKPTLWCMLSSVLMYVAISSYKSHYRVDSIVALTIVVGGGIIIYMSLALLSASVRKEIRDISKSVV